jgi:ferritin-like metal-binding protein YciE
MPADKELVLAWLKDAYAMETALVPILENHAKDAKQHPHVAERDRQHADETRRHAEMVKECIERLGDSPSAVKTGMGSLIGNMQSVATGMFQDELVKNFLSDYAAEHFEIAAYRALVAGAREIGDEQTAMTCERILREEEAMAAFLEQHLGDVAREAVRTRREAA